LTSPVLAALANAKAAEQANEERALTAKVLAHLKMPAPQGDKSQWPAWASWCDQRKITAFPALPAAVAVFVLNNAAAGDRLEKVIASIGAVHEADGRANPVLSPIVIAALNQVFPPIEPPSGWPKERKADFALLHPGLQKFIVAHERQIIKEMRRAQNEAALARKENHVEQEPTTAARTDRTDAGADRKETPDRSAGSREARDAAAA
jgi:hypothetical protein